MLKKPNESIIFWSSDYKGRQITVVEAQHRDQMSNQIVGFQFAHAMCADTCCSGDGDIDFALECDDDAAVPCDAMDLSETASRKRARDKPKSSAKKRVRRDRECERDGCNTITLSKKRH